MARVASTSSTPMTSGIMRRSCVSAAARSSARTCGRKISGWSRHTRIARQPRNGLGSAVVPSPAALPVGVMIETPAAVLIADRLAEVADFLSVGTNDLTQYTLAVDRGNARLADRFTPLHPAVLRALDQVRRAGAAAGREVSVCGGMASDPIAAFCLLGLGYRVLSVAAPSLPLLRWLVRKVDAADAARCATGLLATRPAAEAATLAREWLGRSVDLNLTAPAS